MVRGCVNGKCIHSWVVIVGIWVMGAIYAGAYLNRGWVPWDEGTLAHSAERVLSGEIPHIDFIAPYTGGLSYLNAAAFYLFGTSLLSMRLMLYGFFIVWLACLIYILRKVSRRWVFVPCAALAVALSIPNYSAPLPSWYNLYFATFGIACLIKYLDGNNRYWIALAGVFGGLSVVVKIIGLYYIAGILLFFTYLEQESASNQGAAEFRRDKAYIWFLVTGVLLLLAAVGRVLTITTVGAVEIFHFAIPVAVLCAVLLFRERYIDCALSSHQRLWALLRLIGPFAIGVAIPVIIFLLPYIVFGRLGGLIESVVARPVEGVRHMASGFGVGSSGVEGIVLSVVLAAVPVLGILATPKVGTSWGRAAIGAGFVVAFVLMLAAGVSQLVYGLVWFSLRSLIPVLAVSGGWLLISAMKKEVAPPHSRKIFLLLAVTSFCSFVQFPYPHSTYFFYVAPLGVVLSASLLETLTEHKRNAAIAIIGAFLLYAVAWLNPGFLGDRGYRFVAHQQSSLMDMERGGLRIEQSLNDEYGRVVELINALGAGDYIFVSPDSPEVYFLAKRRNPTNVILNVFGATTNSVRTKEVLSSIEEHKVRVIVFNREWMSKSLPTELIHALFENFPSVIDTDRFLIRWRETEGLSAF